MGYKPDRCERQRFLEEKRQKRIANFLEKEGDSVKLDIPSLSFLFLSAGFINPDTIPGDEEEVIVDMAETFAPSPTYIVFTNSKDLKEHSIAFSSTSTYGAPDEVAAIMSFSAAIETSCPFVTNLIF